MTIGRIPSVEGGIQPTIVDAKGDILTATAADTPAVLAVGNNGETLVADSSATTGLRWQSNFAAGKNKIINGDFGIWQRGTTFNSASTGQFIADRFFVAYDGSGATRNVSQQTFTPGTAPVAGYEGQYFVKWNQTVAGTSGTYNILVQRIEDVRTFAGQTITLSFWAKAAASATLGYQFSQIFGSGGSSSIFEINKTDNLSVTTSWQRFSATVTMPSISGKTIGTSSYIEFCIRLPLNSTFNVDIWGVQLEAGNTATAFQTATGTLAGELAACKRYYEKSYALVDAPGTAHQLDVVRGSGNAAAKTTGYVNANIAFTVEKRTNPTITIYDTSGASGKCSRGTSGASPTANQTVGTYSIGMNTVGVESSGTQNCEFILYHYVASAEL